MKIRNFIPPQPPNLFIPHSWRDESFGRQICHFLKITKIDLKLLHMIRNRVLGIQKCSGMLLELLGVVTVMCQIATKNAYTFLAWTRRPVKYFSNDS